MANTAVVYARIDPQLKEDVESILCQLGMTPSTLIQMIYSEIKLTRKVPLSLSIPNRLPLCLEEMSKEQFDIELQKGIDDVKNGRTHSLDELDAILKKYLSI